MNKNKILFTKFHGTGNDFIIINQLRYQWIDDQDREIIKKMCHRRFGIGADGLMLINPCLDGINHFEMKYYNSDGLPSTMCGNGGRCITYAYSLLNIIQENKIKFLFLGDNYQGILDLKDKTVTIDMQQVDEVFKDGESYVLDTGSPHYVQFLENISRLDVRSEGAKIRNNNTYKSKGINVNFCTWKDGVLNVKTYERGVEDETYSCGTGVVAASIALITHLKEKDGIYNININTLGGHLKVQALKEGSKFSQIKLTGPAVKVFEGIYEI